MTTQWIKCKQCNGAGTFGSFFSKTTCRRCDGKGRIFYTRLEQVIDEGYARLPEEPKSRQLSDILQLKEFLDKLCVPNLDGLQVVIEEHFAQHVELNPDKKINIEKQLDYFLRMIAVSYVNIGKFFTDSNKIRTWENNRALFQKYLICAIQAYETSIMLAENAPSDIDGGANHIKAVAYFGLAHLALLQNAGKLNAEAKHYYRTCAMLPLHTQHQKEFVGNLQEFSKKVEAMPL